VQEPNRNRFEVREVEVYDDFYNIDTDKFFGVKEIVKVTRNTYIKQRDKHSSEISFYISSKKMSAEEYNIGIRAHWSVESMHYVKDVTFGEDASLIRTKNAPTNFSIIRNITINVLRREKYITFPQAIRMIGGNVKRLCYLLE
jgi:predicted transposase YbfD/YdcC